MQGLCMRGAARVHAYVHVSLWYLLRMRLLDSISSFANICTQDFAYVGAVCGRTVPRAGTYAEDARIPIKAGGSSRDRDTASPTEEEA